MPHRTARGEAVSTEEARLMFRPRIVAEPVPRCGVILLVVIALLTLFAVVGISFVMYAQQRADAARVGRESQQQVAGQTPSATPQELLKEFAASFILGQPDIFDK